MKVHHIMSRSVVTVTPQTTFSDLWKAIFQKHVNALPVVDKNNRLLGIITREDLLSALYPDYRSVIDQFTGVEEQFEELENALREKTAIRAKDVMNAHVIFTRHDTPVMRALSRMIARRLNQLPVLSPEDRVIGVITKGDVFYALFKKHALWQKTQRGAAQRKTSKKK